MANAGKNFAVRVISSNPLAALHLAHTLKNEPNIEVDFADANSAVPDIFLIDTTNLNPGPEAAVRTLATRHPKAKFILILNGVDSHESADLFLFLFGGIHGVVGANEIESQLAETIRAVAHGNFCFPMELLDARVRAMGALDPDLAAGVHWTPRERTILALLERRFANKDIAEALGIAETTVKSYVSAILSKLGVNSRRDLSRPNVKSEKIKPTAAAVSGTGSRH